MEIKRQVIGTMVVMQLYIDGKPIDGESLEDKVNYWKFRQQLVGLNFN